MELRLKAVDYSPATVIPKIFYQTWKTKDLSPGMSAARETWLSKHPDWTHVLVDDAEQRAFVADFGSDVVKAYDMLKSGAFKSDLWRYCQLYKSGGVYADIDSVCVEPLESYLRADDQFVSSEATPREGGGLGWVVYQAIIAARPGHPFLERAIERGVGEILAGEKDGFLAIGPSGLGMSINQVLGRPDKTPNVAGNYDGYRLLKKRGGELFADDVCVFLHQYDGYKAEAEAQGVAHWRTEETKPSLLDRAMRKLRRA